MLRHSAPLFCFYWAKISASCIRAPICIAKEWRGKWAHQCTCNHTLYSTHRAKEGKKHAANLPNSNFVFICLFAGNWRIAILLQLHRLWKTHTHRQRYHRISRALVIPNSVCVCVCGCAHVYVFWRRGQISKHTVGRSTSRSTHRYDPSAPASNLIHRECGVCVWPSPGALLGLLWTGHGLSSENRGR